MASENGIPMDCIRGEISIATMERVPFKVDNKTKYRFMPRPYANGEMDFYRLVDSLPVRPSPEIEHALKKQLFTGQRGHKSELQDLKEAKLSIEMRISYLEGIENGNA